MAFYYCKDPLNLLVDASEKDVLAELILKAVARDWAGDRQVNA